MKNTLARGAVAALLTMGFTASLSAQRGGGGFIRPREPGDSTVVRVIVPAMVDSIAMITRALNRETVGSPAWLELTHKLDSLMMANPARIMLRSAMPAMFATGEFMPRGWIGFNAQGPSQIYLDSAGYRVTYFGYPRILSVDPESPADKAGIVPGDLLIAYNGTDVRGNEFNLTKLLVPEKRLAVTIRRDGDKKEYSLDVVKVPEGVFNRRVEFSRVPGIPMPPEPPNGRMRIEIQKDDAEHAAEMARRAVAAAPVIVGEGRGGGRASRARSGPLLVGGYMIITPHGVLGANVSPVGDDLAKALKLEKGMLVNEVPEQSPAYKAGLRAGDVIVSVSGQPVVTLSELQDQIMTHFGDRSVGMQIVRNKKSSRITVTW